MMDVLGALAPRLLVTAAVLVMGPAGQLQLICEVIVQVVGFAQPDEKFPTFQLTELPETFAPQLVVMPVRQEGRVSVTITLFSAPRL